MKIPWANPYLDNAELDEVKAAFDANWLSMGPRTLEFERLMGRYIGVKNAIAVSNGTVALDLALKALGVREGDEVIVPAMTYVATVSSVLYQSAVPVFADIELDTFNIDISSVKELITGKTKCIVYIDYGGNPADQTGLKGISKEYGIPLLQDGAQSLGGEFEGEKLCKQGSISTTSFHIAKLMTTVEGGMIFTEDAGTADVLRMMRNQGEDPAKKYIHKVLGTNARMMDMQAAVGLRQMEKLEKIIKRRRAIAARYYGAFEKEKKIKIPAVREGCLSVYFFAPILVEGRLRVEEGLNKAGISTRIAYPMPVYEQPFFKRYAEAGRKYACPRAKWMTERVLNLPMFHSMTDAEVDYVITTVLDIVSEK